MRARTLRLVGCFLIALILCAQDSSGPAGEPSADAGGTPASGPPATPLATSLIEPKTPAPPLTVQWSSLARESSRFLVLEHAFRLATEPGTRSPGEAFFPGYVKSVTSLHGWADGDPFYVNYVGHPMQGAVAGYLFVRNDPRYWGVQFGRNREYWRSRLRAAAFAWAYSAQFEIGLLSEASIGAIQSKFPQYGFVDHVVTPTFGLAWMIAEDAIDKYIVDTLQRRVDHPYLINILRGTLTPSRTMANVLGFNRPWARESRIAPKPSRETEVQDTKGAAPFEASIVSRFLQGSSGPCIGGTGEAAFRLRPDLQLVVEVGGCKMTGLERDWSGDSLSYLVGPRWRAVTNSRWTPYAHFLVGGNKITEEEMFPAQKAALEAKARLLGQDPPDHNSYTRQYETNGFSIAAGTGVDVKLNAALALRVARLEYTRSWVRDLNGFAAPNGLQMSTGLVLRMGTW